ncbi:hypothetical protein [uncultured Varibaculum sp.]|uniref:hypothetical protein n=1 Tax=uncultured Varibaculum sp. TaxID=413896 RepID=UPI002592C22C|nr:hypothetical protein [uncultured Varibaculum sp.]
MAVDFAEAFGCFDFASGVAGALVLARPRLALVLVSALLLGASRGWTGEQALKVTAAIAIKNNHFFTAASSI